MEEINLLHLLKYFKTKIILVILILCLVSIISYLYFASTDKVGYSSNAVLVVTDDKIESNSYSAKSLIETYMYIFKSKKVLNQVIENLDLNITTSELKSQIKTKNIEDSNIIEITVTRRKSNDVEKIMNELIDVFLIEVESIYEDKSVIILDNPTEASPTTKMTSSKKILLSIFIGVLCSVGGIFLSYLMKESK